MLNTFFDLGSKALGGLANSLGTVVDFGADALAHIPVVGDTLSQGIGAIGDAGVEVLQGNFGTALGDLYGGVDVLAGGILPGGQAASQGYLSKPLSNLYGKADNALGGYLPNFGIEGTITPEAFQNAAKAAQGMTDAEMMHSGFSGVDNTAGGSGFMDKVEKALNIANTGLGIYSLTQDTPEARNAQAYQRATGATTGGPRIVTPGSVGGNALTVGSGGSAGDPAMAGGSKAKSTAGSAVDTPNLSDKDLNAEIKKQITNTTKEMAENVTGQKAPSAPAQTEPTTITKTTLQIDQPKPKLGTRPMSNIPGGPRREYLSKPTTTLSSAAPATAVLPTRQPRVTTTPLTPYKFPTTYQFVNEGTEIPADMLMNTSASGPTVPVRNALSNGYIVPYSQPDADMIMNSSLQGPTRQTIAVPPHLRVMNRL
tara:strand:+ start:340 stop:1617 length:1278 start_codon:yes stop_codon:yes gene_type:complete